MWACVDAFIWRSIDKEALLAQTCTCCWRQPMKTFGGTRVSKQKKGVKCDGSGAFPSPATVRVGRACGAARCQCHRHARIGPVLAVGSADAQVLVVAPVGRGAQHRTLRLPGTRTLLHPAHQQVQRQRLTHSRRAGTWDHDDLACELVRTVDVVPCALTAAHASTHLARVCCSLVPRYALVWRRSVRRYPSMTGSDQQWQLSKLWGARWVTSLLTRQPLLALTAALPPPATAGI